jgi:tetratricopeptide (TPR) repeat protein
MTHFDPDALLARLERRLAVLAEGPRDVSERHQTLRGAIDWSFSLLSHSEQAIFARLSVFLGGCTIEAAEAVCDPAGELHLLAGVESLVQKSLLRLDGVGEPHISMLETIREYAVEKLGEVGETETMRDRHTRYFARLPQEMRMGDPARWEPEHPHGLKRLEAEVDNLRAALGWCQTRGEGELGLRLYSSLFWFWEMRGEFSEGQRWADVLLIHRHGANRRVQAAALWVAGVVAGRREQFERAGEYLEESLTLFREVGDRRGMSWALLWLGNVAAAFGDLERAVALEAEGRELAQRDGERWVAAIASANLGRFALQRGDLTQAQELFEETLAGYRAAGHTGYVSGMLYQLAALALQQGQLERGTTLLTEALAVANQVGHRQVLIQCLIATADLAVREQESERAAWLLGAAEAANAKTGAAWSGGRVMEVARAQMSEAAWRRAWQEGWDTPLEEAVTAAVAYAAGDRRRP